MVGVPCHGHVAPGVGLAGQPVALVEQVAQPLPLPAAGRVEVLGPFLHHHPVGAAVAAGAFPGQTAVGPDRHPQDVDLVAVGELVVPVGGLEMDPGHGTGPLNRAEPAGTLEPTRWNGGAPARHRSADENLLRLGRRRRRLFLDPRAQVGLDVGLVEGLGVGEAHVGRLPHDVDALLLELGGVGVLQHDLVAPLTVDLVGGDVQVEELGLPLGELVLVDEGGVLGPVDGRDLRLQAHDQRGGGHGEVLGARHVVHPALQPLGERGGVAPVLHVLPGAAAGLGEADEQIGVAVVAQLLLVHVLEQEVLGVPGVVGGLGVHQAQVVPEGPHVVVVVGGPVNEVVLVEFARGPGPAERSVLGHGAREGLLQGHPELLR